MGESRPRSKAPRCSLAKCATSAVGAKWEIVEEFTDTMTGSKESRPALNRFLAAAKRRQFDVVLVYRYDRFARSLRQLVNALGEFDDLGIHFVSLHVRAWPLPGPGESASAGRV